MPLMTICHEDDLVISASDCSVVHLSYFLYIYFFFGGGGGAGAGGRESASVS